MRSAYVYWQSNEQRFLLTNQINALKIYKREFSKMILTKMPQTQNTDSIQNPNWNYTKTLSNKSHETLPSTDRYQRPKSLQGDQIPHKAKSYQIKNLKFHQKSKSLQMNQR